MFRTKNKPFKQLLEQTHAKINKFGNTKHNKSNTVITSTCLKLQHELYEETCLIPQEETEA